MSDDGERSWFDTAVGAVGCAGGSIAILATGTATGASCAASATGVGAVGCGLGIAAVAYEVDQTQASCRQMWTGQSTQTLGNELLGGGYLGLGYDLAGLAGAMRSGGAKLAGMISKARAANKLGDLATAARESGTLTDFLKGCQASDIEDLLKNGKVTAEELEAAGIKVPPGALGGNVSKAEAAAAEAAKAARAKAAAEKLGKLKDINSPEAKALIKEVADNSMHGPADAPLILGKHPDYVDAAKAANEAGNPSQWYETADGVYDAMKGNPEAVWAVNEQVLSNAAASGVPMIINGIEDPARLVGQYAAEGKDFRASALAKEIDWISKNIPAPNIPAAGAWATNSASNNSERH